MPDNHSPEVPGTGEDSPITAFEHELDETVSRKWWCPGDHIVATYADGGLSKRRRAWIENHMSNCLRCRLLVADVLKAQRESHVAPAPIQLIQRAKGLASPRRAPRLHLWAPAGALAGIALLIGMTKIAYKPESIIAHPVPAPAAPMVAMSEPPPAPRSQVPDVVRNAKIPALAPILLTPRPDGMMSSNQLRFSWKPFPHTRNYEVRIVKSDGDLIWAGETAESALQVPSNLALQDGSYFVWIMASLDDGQRMKSAPVRFFVRRSH